MAKTKTPFFGLDAHGSVGGSITAQGLSKETLVRTKPLPTYRYTLAQAYQRWLYEDYAYLWTQQSQATQAEYRSAGVRFHLTGFQYWIKDMLTRLPDIVAIWHLDEKAGAVAYDSSRNANHGTIFGASPADGLIDGALSFDGLNDRILIPTNSTLDLSSALTIETFIYLDETIPLATIDTIMRKDLQYAYHVLVTGIQFLQLHIGGAWHPGTFSITPLTPYTPHHIVAVYNSTDARLYLDGFLDIPPAPEVGDLDPGTNPLYIGGDHFSARFYTKGFLDHTILYNRALDPNEILRHSLRRYPP